MGFSMEASYSVSLLSFPQHDGKGLVVSPSSCQVDMGVQKVTSGGDKTRYDGGSILIEFSC